MSLTSSLLLASLLSELPTWLVWARDPRVILTATLSFAVLFVVTLLGLPALVTRLPADYFAERVPTHRKGASWFGRVAANTAGAVLLLLGIAMLILPGQGVLTILVALVLLDFPGKHRAERWLVRRPKVLSVLNSLRRRAGRQPFIVD